MIETLARAAFDHDPLAAAVVGLPSPVDRMGRPIGRHLAGIDVVKRLGLRSYVDCVTMRNDAYLGAV